MMAVEQRVQSNGMKNKCLKKWEILGNSRQEQWKKYIL